MTKLFISILAFIGLVGGGVLIYNAAEQDIQARRASTPPDNIQTITNQQPVTPTQIITPEPEPNTVEQKNTVAIPPQQPIEQACIYGNMVNRRYEANSPQDCNLVDYMCDFESGEKSFRDSTGCGCYLQPEDTASNECVATARVEYYGESAEECRSITNTPIVCDEGKIPFAGENGCGCYTPEGRNTNEYDTAGITTQNPTISRIENNMAWYVYSDQFTPADYQNHCVSHYGGTFNSCVSPPCRDGACPENCNMVCVLP